MNFRAALFSTLILFISVPPISRAAEWYVDVSVADSGDGTSPETAFKTIEEGIAAASVGDEVIVTEGIYVENVNVNGKNVVLRSTDPAVRKVVEKTIIDGNGAGSAVTFAGTEDETCALSGFTIRNGKGANGGGILGGSSLSHTHAAIENCIIANNTAAGDGGGATFCDGVIENCILWGNAAQYRAPQIDETSLTFCCVDQYAPGEDNIGDYPRFVDLDGPDDYPSTHDDNDYCLQPDRQLRGFEAPFQTSWGTRTYPPTRCFGDL